MVISYKYCTLIGVVSNYKYIVTLRITLVGPRYFVP